MRVTAATKAATRERILEAARQLFAANGFEAATTRDLADAAGIASGTLFNYFAAKEAILAALVAEAVEKAHQEFEARDGKADSFEEELFALVATELRHLRTLRKHLTTLFETVLSPLAAADSLALREAHLEIAALLAKKHQIGELSPVALQLYWTLYTGVLMFWAGDKSPKQEDTLALLDNSLAMFVGWLRSAHEGKP